MSNSLPHGSHAMGQQLPAPHAPLRRALLIDAGSATRLQPQLAVSGYETRTATAATALRVIEEFAPNVVLIELRRTVGAADAPGPGEGAEGATSQECLALARKLRAEPATYVLPLVFVFDEDERHLRNAALSVGADDYFSVWTPAGEMLARLDALFWRAEAGRRAASVAGDQRLEIDNFILLLDTVRTAMRAGESGTLALLFAAPARAGETLERSVRDRTLAEAHGFLKLNLRRIDDVTFYGPTMLLIYLPRTDAATALAALSRLRQQFVAERPELELAAGLASFPEDGDDVEALIEKAEAAAQRARDLSSRERIRSFAPAHAQEALKREPAPADAGPLQLPATQAVSSPAPFAQDILSMAERGPLEERQVESLNGRGELDERLADHRFGQEIQRQSAASSSSSSSSSSSFSASTPSSASTGGAGASSTSTAPSGQGGVPLNSTAAQAGRRGGALTGGASSASALSGEDAVKAAIEAGAREMERRAAGAIMPRRLLLTVSDAARMAQVNALIRSAGYEARAAFDGQQALDLLRIERPDLLLLDYQLQGMDGVETLRRLRKQSGGRLKLPVVLLLPPEQELARREALELGARAVVMMPYDPAELLEKVRRAGNAE